MNNTLRLTITVGDPWELGEILKWQPLSGDLLRLENDERGGHALIRLDEPIQYRGTTCRYVIAAPRHQGGEMADLSAGKNIVCGLTAITDQQAESANPFDLGAWRGGLAFIGDVKAVAKS